MKSFIASLLLFSLMLGGIFWNCRYLSELSRELHDAVLEIPSLESEEGDTARRIECFGQLSRLWKKHRDKVSFTVTMHMVEGIDDRLGALEAAIRYGDAREFYEVREHLLRIIDDLAFYDALQLGSIL